MLSSSILSSSIFLKKSGLFIKSLSFFSFSTINSVKVACVTVINYIFFYFFVIIQYLFDLSTYVDRCDRFPASAEAQFAIFSNKIGFITDEAF